MSGYITEQDKQHADRMMFALRTRNKKQLAEEIAFLRETTISCTVARIEREFKLTPRKREKAKTP